MTPLPAPAEASNSSENRGVVDLKLLDAYSGRYEVESIGLVYTVAREGEVLTLEQDDDPAALHAIDESTFASRSGDLVIRFQRDANGSVGGGTLKLGPESPLRVLFNAGPVDVLRRLEPWAPPTDSLIPFAGRYYSRQLETTYQVVEDDGGLLLRHRRRVDARIEPKEKDAFAGDFPFMSVTFDRDESNRVAGFSVLVGGTTETRFEKSPESGRGCKPAL